MPKKGPSPISTARCRFFFHPKKNRNFFLPTLLQSEWRDQNFKQSWLGFFQRYKEYDAPAGRERIKWVAVAMDARAQANGWKPGTLHIIRCTASTPSVAKDIHGVLESTFSFQIDKFFKREGKGVFESFLFWIWVRIYLHLPAQLRRKNRESRCILWSSIECGILVSSFCHTLLGWVDRKVIRPLRCWTKSPIDTIKKWQKQQHLLSTSRLLRSPLASFLWMGCVWGHCPRRVASYASMWSWRIQFSPCCSSVCCFSFSRRCGHSHPCCLECGSWGLWSLAIGWRRLAS